MDSVTGLLKSYNREVVRVVIDKATKYGHAIPIYIPCILGKATIKEAEQVLVDSKAMWHCLRFKLRRAHSTGGCKWPTRRGLDLIFISVVMFL